jgi:predicted acetyltransferase
VGKPRLIEPAEQYCEAFLDYVDDFRAAGEPAWSKAEVNEGNFAAHVQRLLAESRGEGLPDGHVPQSTLWLVARGRILGDCDIRWQLNEALEDYGGHIGYGVRPSDRGQGYGTLILRLALDRARELGLRRVLVSCDATNVASSRVIERNRGRLASESYSDRAGRVTKRYWIEL